MSVDTNLHRTFDYQLSPAPLRIIDWAPVKLAAAAVLQSGPAAKSFTVVDRASANEAATAAAYAQQESVLRELARAQKSAAAGTAGGGGSSSHAAAGGSGEAVAVSTAAEAVESSLLCVSTGVSNGVVASASFAVNQADASALTAASPYYTPGAAVNTPGEVVEWGGEEGQRLQLEGWSGNSGEEGRSSPAMGAAAGMGRAYGAATPAPASAAVNSSLSVAAGYAGDANGALAGAVNNSGVSGTATPKTGAAPAMRAVPSQAASAVPPRIARSQHQWNAAGNMYGFDSVYSNGSFGLLLGLFTGVGYQQTNVVYRQEEGVSSGAAAAASSTAAGVGGANGGGPSSTAAGTAAAAAAVPPLAGSGAPTTHSATHRSTSEHNGTTLHAGAAADANGSSAEAATNAAASPLASAVEKAGGSPRSRGGAVLAHRSKGGFQLSNTLQLFWYWGARRWTGVVNFRFMPLLSGDAILPVCECVTRTEITETSLLIDDPVVYMHSFVVMLGRRKRISDDALCASVEKEGTALGLVSAPHPLVAAAAKSVDRAGEDAKEEVMGAAGKGSKASAAAHEGARAARSAAPQPPQQQQSQSLAAYSSKRADVPAAEAHTHTRAPSHASLSSASSSPAAAPGNTTSSARHPPPRGSVAATAPPHQNGRHTHSGGPPSSQTAEAALPSASAAAAADTHAIPEWLYWYQRCMLDSSDEWLWNRAAADVAAAAARSTTPWWKLRHVKTGVGLSYRYRKPRGINVYWGWSAQLGRGTSLSGHVDVLRRMSCAISSSFGYLDLSVRLRVNLVTLHQTALDAGLCWRPMPQVPELAVRLATSANGTTLGIEMADVAPLLYAPVVERLARYRAQKQTDGGVAEADAITKEQDVHSFLGGSQPGLSPSAGTTSTPAAAATTISAPTRAQEAADGNKEDLVGLLPVTWHYLQGVGSTITHAYAGVAGAVASTWRSTTKASDTAERATEPLRSPAPLPASAPLFVSVPQSPAVGAEATLAGALLPAGSAAMGHLRQAWHFVADLGWLETMLRTSHMNVSMGVTAEPGKLTRDWSVFLIVSEK